MKTAGLIFMLIPVIALSKGIENDTFLVRMEGEINVILNDLRNAKTDGEREMFNMDLRESLKGLLEYPDVMTYPFSSWTTMSTISAPDGAFRLFNWNVEDDFGTHSHYCYLVKPNGGKENTIIELIEDRITISPRPDQTLTADHWYGALYYNIIPVKKGNKTLYTIFGYNGNDRNTNRKLLDVFYFKGKQLRMGYPLFQEAPNSAHLLRRVFFEYSEKAIISVRMNDKLGAIVFDHLVPESPQLEGIWDYYIPDMTYDGYKWENGLWVYVEDIVAYNDPNLKIRQYGTDDDGNDTYREVNDVWVNPVDPNAPAGGGNNAVAPVESVNNNKKNKKSGSGDKKHRQFKFVNRLKGPRSAITGERSRQKKNRN